jgi:hypothetical protein
VRALPAAAVHHHDRVRVAFFRRDHVLHKHLPERDGAVRHALALDAGEEAALIGQPQRRRFFVGMWIGSAG